VNLDGTGFALLDPGNATHNAQLSPNKKWIVDNFSRVDLVPTAVVRDVTGKVVMDLETMDVTVSSSQKPSQLSERELQAAAEKRRRQVFMRAGVC
jgi:hypothetical protein